MLPKNSLFSRIKNYKSRISVIILCNFVAAFFAVLFFLLLEPFIKILFEGDLNGLSPVSSFFVSQLSKVVDINVLTSSMVGMVLIVIFFFILKNFFTILSSWLMATIKSRFIQNIRNEIYERITILPLSYFSQKKRGDIISRAVNDVQELENTLLKSLQQFLTEPITILIYFVTLLLIDYKLTLFTLLLLPFAGFFISLASRKLRKKSAASKEGLGNLFSHIEESLSGLRIVKGFNAQQHATEVFDKENKKYTKLYNHI
jgi:subfamily B ATP-binding cassette protein MsbA